MLCLGAQAAALREGNDEAAEELRFMRQFGRVTPQEYGDGHSAEDVTAATGRRLQSNGGTKFEPLRIVVNTSLLAMDNSSDAGYSCHSVACAPLPRLQIGIWKEWGLCLHRKLSHPVTRPRFAMLHVPGDPSRVRSFPGWRLV